jgi:hypothetical protein
MTMVASDKPIFPSLQKFSQSPKTTRISTGPHPLGPSWEVELHFLKCTGIFYMEKSVMTIELQAVCLSVSIPPKVNMDPFSSQVQGRNEGIANSNNYHSFHFSIIK